MAAKRKLIQEELEEKEQEMEDHARLQTTEDLR